MSTNSIRIGLQEFTDVRVQNYNKFYARKCFMNYIKVLSLIRVWKTIALNLSIITNSDKRQIEGRWCEMFSFIYLKIDTNLLDKC